MSTIRELISIKQRNCANYGGSFTFSVTWTPEVMKEIEEMGEGFLRYYDYSINTIPGMKTCMVSITTKQLDKKK